MIDFLWIATLVAAFVYVLFFRRDPAIERFERALKESRDTTQESR